MTASLMMVTKNANGKNEHYVFKLVDTVAGGAGVPVTAVGLLASGNWYPGGKNDTKSIKNAKKQSCKPPFWQVNVATL